MSDESKNVSFEHVIKESMEAIDSYLTELQVPIPGRVDLAAHEFVEFCILDVKGDTKKDYLLRPWFRFVYRTVRRWYEDKYGAALHRPDAFFEGACEILGSLFRLQVPMHSQARTIGVLAVQSYDPAVRFSESDKALLQSSAPTVAAADRTQTHRSGDARQ